MPQSANCSFDAQSTSLPLTAKVLQVDQASASCVSDLRRIASKYLDWTMDSACPQQCLVWHQFASGRCSNPMIAHISQAGVGAPARMNKCSSDWWLAVTIPDSLFQHVFFCKALNQGFMHLCIVLCSSCARTIHFEPKLRKAGACCN